MTRQTKQKKQTKKQASRPSPKKLRIGILFGGRSGEHEVSLLSAASILNSIDQTKYEVIPVGITKQGQWLTSTDAQHLLAGNTKPAPIQKKRTATKSVALRTSTSSHEALAQQNGSLAQSLDVIFPVLHGTFGEDGTIQGLFELADIAYVGSGVLGSATGMDKSVMKQLFAAAGLPQTPHVNLLRSEWNADAKRCIKRIEKKLSYPVFVKPANLGSSVGISKVHDRSELAPAMDLAASFDRKLIIEQGVGGPGAKPRELEVAVLGNDSPEASVVGEIVPGAEFYDYNAKYHSDASIPIIPAKLSKSESKQIREMAIAAFRACDCAGLARVDFLMEPAVVNKKGKESKAAHIYLNEINTMPGFTSISMYPKLWEASGLPYRQLIDRLIALAAERHQEKQQTTFTRV
ncbi:D-alanine--D-alanine ligase [Tunturiibacter gelidoferens]|uniref:D-alanine-D-alanine ligase n=1 Tax=Tunturiibacter gelidiferens TaxID=3069689 RepID=A0ACC5P2E9_9BACT|nr:D-alanine--D-alanine ligase [Edaphobacter lichenicola]MBB5340960.1 D-alanine-D-alanine ligase [Edaphobacter lichenicola]